jgi:hypothetical protein
MEAVAVAVLGDTTVQVGVVALLQVLLRVEMALVVAAGVVVAEALLTLAGLAVV